MGAPDRWAGATDYERFIGRWSRPVGRIFIEWLGPPSGLRWLDVGSGTGALTDVVLAAAAPASVIGVEPSASFVAHASATVGDPRASFVVGSAEALPLDAGTVDVAVAGLVLNFVADLPAALGELRRVVVAGGTAGGFVWDYADRMEMLRRFWDAAVALDAAASRLAEGTRFPICAAAPLRAAFTAAGFEDVDTRAIEIPLRFVDFDDYWSPFLTGVGPAPGYTVALDDDRRLALRERLRTTLPVAPDGSIELVGRAWAVRGTTPAA